MTKEFVVYFCSYNIVQNIILLSIILLLSTELVVYRLKGWILVNDEDIRIFTGRYKTVHNALTKVNSSDMDIIFSSYPFSADVFWVKKYEFLKFLQPDFNFGSDKFMNHVHNESLFTQKDDLTHLLDMAKKRLGPEAAYKIDNFYPETYSFKDGGLSGLVRRMDRLRRTEDEPNESWILKPTRRSYGKKKGRLISGGRGIKVMSFPDTIEFLEKIQKEEHLLQRLKDDESVIQKYIHNPLLVDGKKISIRMFFIIVDVDPLRVLIYKEGRTYSASREYNSDITSFDDPLTHLTNPWIQRYLIKNLELDLEVPDRLYLHDLHQNLMERGLADETWLDTFLDQSIELLSIIMRQYHTFLDIDEIRRDRENKPRLFGFYDFDITLDEDLRPWLMECQNGPGYSNIGEHSPFLEIVPAMFEETLKILRELKLSPEPEKLVDFESRENFLWVVNEAVYEDDVSCVK